MALCPDSLNILSLCTGGLGLDLGVELAIPDARTVCMVEREGFAVAQLVSAMEAQLVAPAPIWSDARTFDGRAWRGAVDGLIGGIPCQPHSLAGRKKGQHDERDLWSDARRIIVQSGVWFVVIENVSGMLSAGDDEIAGADRVHRDLCKLGFEVEGGLFTASEVGAPHQRERVFILAVADPSSRGHQSRSRRHGIRSDEVRQVRISEPREHGEGVLGVGLADADCQRLEGQRADDRTQGRPDARRSAGLCDGTTLDNTLSRRRPERRHDHGSHVGNQLDATGEHAVVNAEGVGCRTRRAEPEGQRRQSSATRTDNAVANANSDEQAQVRGDAGEMRGLSEAQRQPEHRTSLLGGSRDSSVFPPGPNELDRWREVLSRSPELEPAFRRVADGVATRLDIARVDRLRMLGNGVVPLEAAYAIRTLVTRLAARGSTGAARLVWMMEGIAA